MKSIKESIVPINKYLGIDESYTKITENGKIFHRIVALKDFAIDGYIVKKEQLGGWIGEKRAHGTFSKFWVDYSSLVEYGDTITESIIGPDVVIRGVAYINHSDISGGVRLFASFRSGIDIRKTCIRGKIIITDSAIRDSFMYSMCSCYNDFLVSKSDIYNSTFATGWHSVFLKECSLCYVTYASQKENGNLYITKGQDIKNKYVCGDYDNNFIKSLVAQTGLMPVNGKVYAYKVVNMDMSSIYDEDFVYKVGEVAFAKNICEDKNVSCGGGLHFSTADYFRGYDPLSFKTLYAEIDVKDIIAVQAGKIRCRKAKILGVCDTEI